MKNYNYKLSLDPNIHKAIEDGEIFKTKIFTVSGKEKQCAKMELDFERIKKHAFRRETVAIVFSVFSKFLSIILFYYPFVMFNYMVSMDVTESNVFYFINWIAFFGIIVGSFILLLFSTRSVFIFGCAMLVSVLFATCLITAITLPSVPLMVFIWIGFFIFGFIYAYPDVICFELVSLKYIELILFVGYMFEMMLVGFMVYYTLKFVDVLFCFNCPSYNVFLILGHFIAFIGLSLILSVAAYYIMPKIHSHQSLLETKNVVLINVYRFKFRKNKSKS